MQPASHASERAWASVARKMITLRGSPQMTGQASGTLNLDARRALRCAKNAIVHANYANGCAVMLAWRRFDTRFSRDVVSQIPPPRSASE